MDPIKNPFSPGAGSPPPELVGRDPILDQAKILLGRIKQKKPEKSILLTGLRGVGKTVLLNEIKRLAEAEEYRTIAIEAHEDKPLGRLIAPYLRSLLFELDRRRFRCAQSQGDQPGAGAGQTDQEGNDLQPRARRAGVYRTPVRRVHDPRDSGVSVVRRKGIACMPGDEFVTQRVTNRRQ